MQLLIITAALLSVLVQCCCAMGSPPNCLRNRLDLVPCNIVNTQSTDVPQDNEYVVYSTRIRDNNGNNQLTCEIRSRDDILQSLPTIGGDPRILYLISAGYSGSRNYGNEQLVRYRVQCPNNHFSYFKLINLDLEPPTCIDNNGQARCVDYLQVSRGGGNFGFLEVCGNVIPSSLQSQLDSGTVEVVMRTSETVRFPGFSASVVCVNTSLLLPNSNANENAALQQFNVRVQRRVEYVHRLRRSTVDETIARSLACSVDEVNIPFDAGITYIDGVVRIVDINTMRVIRKLPAPINRLTILDCGSEQEFMGDAPLTNGSITVFPGPGPLTRAGVYVFYTSFTTIPELCNIPPELVIPSGLEAEVTDILLAGHVSQAMDQQIACNFTDREILLAILNQHSINPVLATIADVILNCTSRTQPGRIEPIAAVIPGLYDYTSSLKGSTHDDRYVRVELQNGTFRFQEQEYTSVFVNTNGVVSLISEFTDYTPEPFPLSLSNPLLAPFWADIDPTRGGSVLYRETQDVVLLSRYASEVRTAFPNLQSAFTPVSLFIVTWFEVLPYRGANENNTFQFILATDGQLTFVTFLYDCIQWTESQTGRSHVGIDGGDGVRRSLNLSSSDDIRNLTTTSNVGMDGMWMFRVDSSYIISPQGPILA